MPADLDQRLVAAGPDLVPAAVERREHQVLERVPVRGARYISWAAMSANCPEVTR